MNLDSNRTYSRQVKDELLMTPVRDPQCLAIELGAALVSAGRFRSGQLSLTTAHMGFAAFLATGLTECYHVHPVLQAGREIMTLLIEDRDSVQQILIDLIERLGFDPVRGTVIPPAPLPASCRQAALRAVFLACGSISDPQHSYHLEFSIRRAGAAAWLLNLLAASDITAGSLHRQGHSVIYLKDGQLVSDFLLLSGAHQSMLAFESLRVEKEMRNSVNRVVNCDSANTQRVANASARQLDLLEMLQEAGLFGLLTEELLQAAQARLDHPDLSLKELGETLKPPLGKSGMNHRLKKLEQRALELLIPPKKED